MDYIIKTALELGFLYSLVPLALFLSYGILGIADLTTDGGFVLGMAVSVTMSYLGRPILGIVLAIICGSMAGMITAFLQTKLGVPSILAGIITNTGLYTINLMVMGWKANASLLRQETVFTEFYKLRVFGEYSDLALEICITILIAVLFYRFLQTTLGLSIRAVGDNPDMVKASSINPKKMILIGLAIANGFTALSGALVAQMQKSADINGGTGIVVIGLACLVIGETIIGKKSMKRNICAVFAGSIVYRFIYAMILATGILPIECLKLLTAIVVAVAIAIPTIKKKMILKNKKLKIKKNYPNIEEIKKRIEIEEAQKREELMLKNTSKKNEEGLVDEGGERKCL